jgi:hypothetical protein
MQQRHWLDVTLRSSPRLAAMLFAAHGVALAAAYLIDVPPWLQWALWLAICASLIRTLRVHALRLAPQACTALRLGNDGSCVLRTRSGRQIDGRLVMSGCAVSALLILLRVRPDSRERVVSLVLLPDSADGESLRALRVLLKFGLDDNAS